jgi:hypothetical protein
MGRFFFVLLKFNLKVKATSMIIDDSWKSKYDNICQIAANKAFDFQIKESVYRPVVAYIAADYPQWGQILIIRSDKDLPPNATRVACDIGPGLTLEQIKYKIQNSTKNTPILGA